MNQFSAEPKSGSKFWDPKPGEEVFFRLLDVGRPVFAHPMSSNNTIPCKADGTFETAHRCLHCKVRTGIFVAALMTLFLEGIEAARCYYQDLRS